MPNIKSANVRQRHASGLEDGDAQQRGDLNQNYKRVPKSNLVRGNYYLTLTRALQQAQIWTDETKINLRKDLQRGSLTRETAFRVGCLCIISLSILRLLVQFLLYAASLDAMNEIDILIPTVGFSFDTNGNVITRKHLSTPWIETLPFLPRSIRPRRNNIEYHPLRADAFDTGRRIREHDLQLYHSEALARFEEWDAPNEYHDSREKDLGRYIHYEEDNYPHENGCYRPKWSYAYHPSCNNFHQFDMSRTPTPRSLELRTEYISHGFFRETFLLQREDDDDAVMKVLRLHKKKNVNAFVMEQVQIEALVMGEASGSGLTFEIYGHCGTSVLVERGYLIKNSIFAERLVNQTELDLVQVDGVRPQNSLTVEQRLRIALTMAESLAVLHGNANGAIANDDVQIEQWLLDRNGHLKLNDFNNAVILEWSPKRSKYCSFRRSFDYIYRSPEENNFEWTNEASDTYALGLILYTLMTGLIPFYQHKDWDTAISALKTGEKPFVDPRYRNHSIIETGLVKAMEPCWAFKPNDRPSVFTLVQILRDTMKEFESKNPGIKIREVDLSNLGYSTD